MPRGRKPKAKEEKEVKVGAFKNIFQKPETKKRENNLERIKQKTKQVESEIKARAKNAKIKSKPTSPEIEDDDIIEESPIVVDVEESEEEIEKRRKKYPLHEFEKCMKCSLKQTGKCTGMGSIDKNAILICKDYKI